MPTFLEYLESFNRKERFFLVGWALDKPTFQLGAGFLAAMKQTVGAIPESALVFMDYHLDWLHASAFLAGRGEDVTGVYDNDPEKIVTGNQEDIDLVIAYPDAGKVRLLIEAKAESRWNPSQLKSKAKRLRAIFGESGDSEPDVRPTFVLTSPEEPSLDTREWPEWMRPEGRPLWVELPVPPGSPKGNRLEHEPGPAGLRAAVVQGHKAGQLKEVICPSQPMISGAGGCVLVGSQLRCRPTPAIAI